MCVNRTFFQTECGWIDAEQVVAFEVAMITTVQYRIKFTTRDGIERFTEPIYPTEAQARDTLDAMMREVFEIGLP